MDLLRSVMGTNRSPYARLVRHSLLAMLALAVGGCESPIPVDGSWEPASTLPDVSGLARLSDSLYLAVHDAKLPEEQASPRVSLVRVSGSNGGATWRPVAVRWPTSDASSDLESVAAIPGTRFLLLSESGDDGGAYRRIFLAELVEDGVRFAEAVRWPTDVFNVEGTAAARVDGRLVFLYAERSQDSLHTRIRWAPLQPTPLAFGEFREVVFSVPAAAGMNRPVSAMEVDPDGWIYVASTFDPDVDDGPYRSMVWRIGRVRTEGTAATVQLDSTARLIARSDGIKIESLAIRNLQDGSRQLIVGSDDEDLGAVIRPLPLVP